MFGTKWNYYELRIGTLNELVEEIWKDQIRLTFDNEQEILETWTVQRLSNALHPKDRAFQATLRREAAKKESSSNSFNRGDRSSSRTSIKPHFDDRKKFEPKSNDSNDKDKSNPSADDKKKWRKDDSCLLSLW